MRSQFAPSATSLRRSNFSQSAGVSYGRPRSEGRPDASGTIAADAVLQLPVAPPALPPHLPIRFPRSAVTRAIPCLKFPPTQACPVNIPAGTADTVGILPLPRQQQSESNVHFFPLRSEPGKLTGNTRRSHARQ